jgi:ATP-dependent RNA helicase DeaD
MKRDDARLMTDPVWTDAPADRDADLAMKIMGRFSPEQIASAVVRLYRGNRSAPEDLLPPEAKGGERPPFGPSRWFALSIGRDRNAEAKWLLPMICRRTGLTRDEIGAIRMQDSETWVEVLESCAARLDRMAATAQELDPGITLRALPGSPYGDRPRPRDDLAAAPPPKRPHRGKDSGAPRHEGNRKDAPHEGGLRKDMPDPRPHVVKPRPPAAAAPDDLPAPAPARKPHARPAKPAKWAPDSAAAVLSGTETADRPRKPKGPKPARPGKPAGSAKPGKPGRAARKATKAQSGGNGAPRRRGR